MDIDPTKKNSEGHYYQHALKDSDPNIRFIKYGTTNMDSRNDFMIELLTSKITENEAIIDMGRKIDYTWHDMKTGTDFWGYYNQSTDDCTKREYYYTETEYNIQHYSYQ